MFSVSVCLSPYPLSVGTRAHACVRACVRACVHVCVCVCTFYVALIPDFLSHYFPANNDGALSESELEKFSDVIGEN